MYKPRLIAFEITQRCRYNCLHCRAGACSVDDNKGTELTTEQCKKILAGIADFHKCTIILTGGEPTEREDLVELIEYSRSLGLRVVMATCGYKITDDYLARLKEAGLMALSLSLDGAVAETHDAFRRTPGAFDAVLSAAETARKLGVKFQINTTITKSNLKQLPAIVELAEQLGAYCFNPFILVPTGRAKDIADQILSAEQYEKLLEELLQLKLSSDIAVRLTCGPQFARLCRQADPTGKTIKSAGCMAGREFCFISYKADVQTCGFLEISAGNLIENNYSFEKVWLGSGFLNEIRDRAAYKGICGRCKYTEVCGGCRARAYTITGDYMASDPICIFYTQ